MATGGRFGKYGDLKRKALIRRGRSTGADRARSLLATNCPANITHLHKVTSTTSTVWKRKQKEKATPKIDDGNDPT